jgi:hypothetical protein
MKKHYLPAVAAVLLFSLLPVQGEEGKLEDVIVTEKDTTIVEREKTPFTVNLDSLKVVRPASDDNKAFLTRRADTFDALRSTRPYAMVSDLTVAPWLNSIAKDSIVTFSLPPREKKKPVSWEFIVIDRAGRPFRAFSGKSYPPQAIDWDGRNGDGVFMKIGSTYSSILRTTYAANRQFTHIGDSFSTNAAEHQEKDGLYLSFALTSLFDGKRASSELLESGTVLLDEASTALKDYYPVPFVIYVYNETESSARSQAEELARYLAKKLVIPVESIAAKGCRAAPGDYSVNIVILNRGNSGHPTAAPEKSPAR